MVLCIVLIIFSDRAIQYFFIQTDYETEQDNTIDYSEEEETGDKILQLQQ